MEPNSLPTEIILTHPRQSSVTSNSIGHRSGNYLDLQGKTYAILERRHRYQLKSGRYRLHKIAIYVQSAQRPAEKSLVEGLGNWGCQLPL